MGQYIYAVADTGDERTLEIGGIAEAGGNVSIICHRDIGAVVSPSPVTDYAVSRKNTMAHQTVMETVMATAPILPVKFGTVGEDSEVIREKLLADRYDELKAHLAYVADKVELGLKVLWTDPAQAYREIVAEDRQIQKLRDRLNAQKGGARKDQIRLGEMVAGALARKRDALDTRIGSFFDGLWVEHKKNPPMGDRMITHSVFLVARDREGDFDAAVNRLGESTDGQMKIKYVGPVPPNHFIELVVRW
ncbi:GvpL/GvpF family gas vesicle protein [Desulfoluna spongiiphila]|uniref:Gas vesicle synthesis protein GvpL/GvpF n=1 Tax=Desulfoluna spongiiphila TaxID=419481 RepID=A0A1G5CNE1_9BACT|nr:GvpL/GvpF family gas vesicle protein [Desulfoluna spongiiphila]SCY03864.1 Gas vesicle synthesis protein GvpL/GvpF [Desulfoluna spongiiphila]